MKKIISISLLFALNLFSTQFSYASGQESFVALNVGSSEAAKLEERDTAFKLSLGYNTNQYLGFELGYVAMGEFNNGIADVEVDGFIIDVLSYWPMSESFPFSERLGCLSGIVNCRGWKMMAVV